MSLSKAAEELAEQGRGGDTRLAHINDYEAEVLKLLGGSGTVNPNTGLEEFKGGGWGLGDILGDIIGGTTVGIEHALDPLDPTWTPQFGGLISDSEPLTTLPGGFNEYTWGEMADNGAGSALFDITKEGNKIADVVAPAIAGGAFAGALGGAGSAAGEGLGAGLAEAGTAMAPELAGLTATEGGIAALGMDSASALAGLGSYAGEGMGSYLGDLGSYASEGLGTDGLSGAGVNTWGDYYSNPLVDSGYTDAVANQVPSEFTQSLNEYYTNPMVDSPYNTGIPEADPFSQSLESYYSDPLQDSQYTDGLSNISNPDYFKKAKEAYDMANKVNKIRNMYNKLNPTVAAPRTSTNTSTTSTYPTLSSYPVQPSAGLGGLSALRPAVNSNKTFGLGGTQYRDPRQLARF